MPTRAQKLAAASALLRSQNKTTYPRKHWQEMARLSGEARRAGSPYYQAALRYAKERPPVSISEWADKQFPDSPSAKFSVIRWVRILGRGGK